jgi:hypothetical protein
MLHEEFKIGLVFWMGETKWRVTDIGTRTIVAIKLNHEDDPSWCNAPPYAVCEQVIDELDQRDCTINREDSNG